MTERIDTENKEELICPYCGYEHHSSNEYFYDSAQEDGSTFSTTVQCCDCEKDFVGIYNSCNCGSSDYSSKKIDCKEKGRSHRWKLRERKLKDSNHVRIEESGMYMVKNFGSDGGFEQRWEDKGDYAFVLIPKEGQYEQDWYECPSCDAVKIDTLDENGNPIKKPKYIPDEELPLPEDHKGEISINDATISIWLDEGKGSFNIFFPLCRMLQRNGLSVLADPQYQDREKWGKSFGKRHKSGEQGELKFTASVMGRHIEFVFWQDLVIKKGRRDGEKYAFNKRVRMHYLIEKQMVLAWNKIIEFAMKKYNLTLQVDIDRSDAEGYVMEEYRTGNHYSNRKEISSLSDLDGTLEDRIINCNSKRDCTDRDGILIVHGDFKYFRDNKGYLMRGKVYHSLNAQWWIICAGNVLEKAQAYYLFNYTSNEPRKLHEDSVGKRHITRLKRELEQLQEEQDFEKCIPIRNRIVKLEGVE